MAVWRPRAPSGVFTGPACTTHTGPDLMKIQFRICHLYDDKKQYTLSETVLQTRSLLCVPLCGAREWQQVTVLQHRGTQ